MLLYQSVLAMDRIDLPAASTQPSSSTQPGAAPTTGPAVPPVAASLQDEPPTPKPPVFDPATYTGPINTLTPEQQQQYRQNLQRKQIQQRQQQQRQQQQRQQSGTR